MKGLDETLLNNQEEFINVMMKQNREHLAENSAGIEEIKHFTTMDALSKSAKIIEDGLKETENIQNSSYDNYTEDMKQLEEMNRKLKEMLNK
jgi:hypothetical protein